MRPKDLPESKINAAKDFLRKPFEVGFKTWMPLKDRDQVTMTFHELSYLLAWYRELGLQQKAPHREERNLEAPKQKQLPGETNG